MVDSYFCRIQAQMTVDESTLDNLKMVRCSDSIPYPSQDGDGQVIFLRRYGARVPVAVRALGVVGFVEVDDNRVSFGNLQVNVPAASICSRAVALVGKW